MVHFSPSNFEVLTTKKPDIVQNVEQKVSFVSIDKHVTGTGDIDYYSHEMFQIENGKIVRIDRYNNSKKPNVHYHNCCEHTLKPYFLRILRCQISGNIKGNTKISQPPGKNKDKKRLYSAKT